ncbi:MAG: GAF domain-containing protein [Actinomycetota bacterium]
MAVFDQRIDGDPTPADVGARLDSYRRLAGLFHSVLSEQSLDALLELVADTLADLISYDTLTIYEAWEADRILVPVLARDQWAEEILRSRSKFGKGITGWAVEHREAVLANDAHLDPRIQVIEGTPLEPEALMSIPLIARGSVKGALNLYRLGEQGCFDPEEFELAKRFGDAAALALDNAQRHAILEHQAKTDPLTGLYNHRYFHERLRAELTRSSRTRDSAAVIMIDIDDFKRVNDVYGHAVGDQVLVVLSEIFSSTVRASDVVCRIGGEEFGIIMPSCDAGDAVGLATRLCARIALTDLDPVGRVTVSIGIAQGPDHATSPRELAACADAAMMTAKERGKDRIVLFEDVEGEGPNRILSPRGDVRSIAYLKMLQSLSGKLNRLNDVRQIGMTISNELRTLIDYHSCLVYVAADDCLMPIAARGELQEMVEERPENLICRIGEGITGYVAESNKPLLVDDALTCPHARQIPGTPEVQESIIAVPLSYGARVIGVIFLSKLGIGQFDEDDVRLLEVLAGHASVALENARLYEAERREAEGAKALLEFADAMAKAPSFYAIGQETVKFAARLFESSQASVWMENDRTRDCRCVAHYGYVDDPTAEAVIRAWVSADNADRLLEGRKGPFVLTPLEQDHYFATPPRVISRTLAIAPLHGLKGWITVRHPSLTGMSFKTDELRLLEGLSHQASVAMQKSRLYRDQEENAEIANALLDFSRVLASASGLDEVLDRIAEQSARILGSPRTSVWLQDPQEGALTPRALWGYQGEDAERAAAVEIPRHVADAFLSSGDPFVFRPEDWDRIHGDLDLAHTFTDKPLVAVVPLAIEGGLGCIAAAAPALGDYEFSERKMRLLSGIADQAKLAIANAGNFENLESTFLSTVEALANALEAKDEYTSSHARWITDTSLEVGRELGLDPATLKRLELGALFHDIGKIGIPSDILLKPGPLTDAEWAVIKTHPELGERILAPIDRLSDVRKIVRHCHEHYDGSGYPDGKSKDDIPIEARVILVVDAFHAMTTDRPYRRGLPIEEAIRRLREASGGQFDPQVVRAFLDVLERTPALTA